MTNWKRWLIALWAAWLLLAYIFAWQRATCGQPWEAACWVSGWKGLGDIILLGWLKDYQEALGGVATLIAAIVAYNAVSFQVGHGLRQEEIRQQDRIRKTVNLVALEFNIAASNIEGGYEGVWLNEKAWRSNVVSDIAEFDPELLEVFRYAENLIDIDIREAAEISESADPSAPALIKRRMKRAAAKAMAAYSIFIDAAAIIGEPPSSFTSYFNAEKIDRFLNKRGLNREHLRDLRHYFDWTKLDKEMAVKSAES